MNHPTTPHEAPQRDRLGEAQKRVDDARDQRARLTRTLAHAAASGLDVAIYQQSIQSLDATLAAATAERDRVGAQKSS